MSFFFRDSPALGEQHPQSRYRLWVFLLLPIFFAAYFSYQAAKEKDVASQEETSTGVIGHCEPRGRENENYCSYVFQVDDETYASFSRAPDGLWSGQTVDVYYDSQNPRISALEASRNNVARI